MAFDPYIPFMTVLIAWVILVGVLIIPGLWAKFKARRKKEPEPSPLELTFQQRSDFEEKLIELDADVERAKLKISQLSRDDRLFLPSEDTQLRAQTSDRWSNEKRLKDALKDAAYIRKLLHHPEEGQLSLGYLGSDGKLSMAKKDT